MEEGARGVLERARAGDPFGVLGLERPGRDALGRPRWAPGDADVSRAFRRAAVRVHPDKFPGSALAAAAFDALNAAQAQLLDPVGRAEAVRKAVEAGGAGAGKVAWGGGADAGAGAEGGAGAGAGAGASLKRERAGLMREEGAAMAARVRLQMEARRKKLEEQREARRRAAEREGRAGGARPGLQRAGGGVPQEADGRGGRDASGGGGAGAGRATATARTAAEG